MDDLDGPSTSYSTPKKKVKWMCSFLDSWIQSFSFIKSVPNNKNKAYCTICRKEFSVSHGGKNDVLKHQNNIDHKKKERSANMSATLKAFVKTDQMSSHEEKVIAAEVTKTYHCVKHSSSYDSLDCETKLDCVVYNDSKIADSLTLGRTKASAIAYNVLAPASIQDTIQILQNGTFYSIATDASNHGTTKMFPLLVRFYSPSTDLKTCVLSLYDDANENALAIYNNLMERLKENDIDTKYLTSFCADNANVNFGSHNSVFQLLRKDNNNIIPIGCPAHIVHNSVKYALGLCNFDLENFILKLHSYFSYYAKREQALKEVFETHESEFAPVLRHVKTRWLSLLPAVERAMKSYDVLKDYFLTLGEDECPMILWEMFNSERTEPYLAFFQNSLKLLHDSVLSLENESLLCFEGYDIMVSLTYKLKQRIEDSFLGFTCNNLIKKISPEIARLITCDCCLWYKNILKYEYIEARFNFQNNKIEIFKPLSLQNEILKYESVVKIIETLNIVNFFDMDSLYEEISSAKDLLLAAVENKDLSITKKWNNIFKNSNFPNLLKIFSFMVSVPVSNAATERVFSQVNILWSQPRNRLTLEHVKAEIQIKSNFNITCREFYEFALKNKTLLKAVKSNAKYKLKKE